jgi:nitroreductase
VNQDAPIGLLEGLATTRAIRRFTSEPVSDEDLATIMFAATRAPSGSNRQPFRFLVLRDGERAREAKGLLGRSFRLGWERKQAEDGYTGASGPGADAAEDTPKARTARALQQFVDRFEEIPVVVLGCLSRYRDPHPFEGASIYPACQNLLLAARAVGLGGVLTMWHDSVEDELGRMLSIPEGVVVAATIPLGHPEGGHGPVRRRPVAELVYEDAWELPAPWAVDPPGTRFAGSWLPAS